MTGMTYVLHTCKNHGLCQHAVACEILFCVPCLVEKAIGPAAPVREEVCSRLSIA